MLLHNVTDRMSEIEYGCEMRKILAMDRPITRCAISHKRLVPRSMKTSSMEVATKCLPNAFCPARVATTLLMNPAVCESESDRRRPLRTPLGEFDQ
jgi:hypothetical protein